MKYEAFEKLVKHQLADSEFICVRTEKTSPWGDSYMRVTKQDWIDRGMQEEGLYINVKDILGWEHDHATFKRSLRLIREYVFYDYLGNADDFRTKLIEEYLLDMQELKEQTNADD